MYFFGGKNFRFLKIALIFSGLFLAPCLFAATLPLKPIFKINDDIKEIPFLWEALLSPAGFVAKEMSIAQVNSLERKLVEMEMDDIEDTDERFLHLKQMFQLISFYDLKKNSPDQNNDNLKYLLKRYIQTAKTFAKKSYDEQYSLIFKYHAMVAQYYLRPKKGLFFTKVKKQKTDLPQEYQDIIVMVQGIENTKTSYSVMQGIKDLTRVQRNIDAEPAKLAVHMALARALAGLSPTGEKMRRTSKRYIEEIKGALDFAEGEKRNRAAAFCFGVWRRADGLNHGASAKKLPFKVRMLQTRADAYAKEYEVLSFAKEGNYNSAIWAYRQWHKKYKDSAIAVALGQRSLHLAKLRYAKTKSAKKFYYEITTLQEYARSLIAIDQPRSKRLLEDVISARINLVTSNLIRARSKESTALARKNAVFLANEELKLLEKKRNKKKEADKIRLLLAQIYTKDKKYHKVESTIKDVSASGSMEKKQLFNLAKSLRLLAGWPKAPPFGKMPSTRSDKREELLNVYKKLYNKSKKETFSEGELDHVYGHYVLLLQSFGKQDAAVKVFSQGAKERPKSWFARNASAGLIKILYADKVWGALDKVFMISKRQNIDLSLAGAPLIRAKMVREMSYNLANKTKKQKAKIKYYNDFLAAKTNEQDPRLAKVHWHLASLYENDGKPKKAIETLENFIKKTRDKAARAKFLHRGFSLAYMKKMDEYAAAFAMEYLETSNGKKAPFVREGLIDVFWRKKAYKKVAEYSELHSKDLRVDAVKRAKAARRALILYDRLKMPQKADFFAQSLVKMFPRAQRARAVYTEHFARRYVKSGNRKKLQELAAGLQRFDSRIKEVAAAKSLLVFEIARQNIPRKVIFSKQNITQSVVAANRQYETVKKKLESLCGGKINLYCGPAKFQIAIYAEKFLNAFNDKNNLKTLSTTDKNRYLSYRKQKVKYLQKNLKQNLSVARRLAKEGNTLPAWKEKILSGYSSYFGTGIIAR